MKIEEAAKISSKSAGYNPKIAADECGMAVYENGFETGARWMNEKCSREFSNWLVKNLGHPFDAPNSKYREFVDEFEKMINE